MDYLVTLLLWPVIKRDWFGLEDLAANRHIVTATSMMDRYLTQHLKNGRVVDILVSTRNGVIRI